jgi:hypothetical protein
MEIVSIVLSVPFVFVASAVYLFLLGKALGRFPWLRPLFLWVSAAVLLAVAAEFAAIEAFGPVKMRIWIGPLFEDFAGVLFLLGCPALVNVLTLPKRGLSRRWPLVSSLASVLAVFLVLSQTAISEALYGVDGSGGPFSPPGTVRPR